MGPKQLEMQDIYSCMEVFGISRMGLDIDLGSIDKSKVPD